MAFTSDEINNIANSALDHYMGRGNLYAQAIQEKPMIAAFDRNAGTFPGGKGDVSIGVKAGNGGLTLAGYTHDDAVTYGNPTPARRVNFPWKEHHIGMALTHTELKHDGITVVEDGADQELRRKSGRERFALANLLDEKVTVMNEDYAEGWNGLLHGDGSGDTKALAGIGSFIFDEPSTGTTGGIDRATTTWWRNRAATAAADTAGSGNAPITSTPANGGALLQFLQEERRQLKRYARSTPRHFCPAGSDFIGAMEVELRANGNYADAGFQRRSDNDGAMNTEEGVPFGRWNFIYDPTMDDLGLAKRAYVIDMKNIKLLYMQGEKMKKHNPARPADRYLYHKAVTTTAVMVAQQLNTSGVYDIA